VELGEPARREDAHEVSVPAIIFANAGQGSGRPNGRSLETTLLPLGDIELPKSRRERIRAFSVLLSRTTSSEASSSTRQAIPSPRRHGIAFSLSGLN